MSRFISKRFDRLTEYTPGEQPQDMEYIKLNTNESPYPPSDGVIRAVNEQSSELMLYPDPDCKKLCEAFSNLLGVNKNNVTFGNGSDEILNFCFMAFCDDKKGVAYPNISYGFYSVFADLYGIDKYELPLKSDFSIDVSDYFGCHRTIFIANPNAPTGIALPLCDIRRLLIDNPDDIVVIDEAYVDFGAQSAVTLINDFENLIVVGTYSKSRSLAGARLGFAAANEALISDINKLRFSTNPYNINRMTLSAGIAAVQDNDYYIANCKKIIAIRERISKQLADLGFFVLPSSANFIFAKCGGIQGKELYLKLKEKGILVRHFDTPLITDFVRITVGNDAQMDALICAVKEII